MHKVLIIDDESSIRKMLKKLLEKNGYQALEANDGKQGIALFKKHEPELIITDLIMPEKEGLETIKELKKIDPDVKIIAMSGGGITDPKIYLNFASKFGAVRTFTKPVDNGILLSTIKEIFS
jgi:YesN/AraC family two-component response regulator